MKNFKQQTKFFQGLALGLVITSAISYAAVSLQTFTAGSPISSAEVNANFAEIKAKLDVLDIGYVGVLPTSVVVTCVSGVSSPAYPSDYVDLVLTDQYNDGHFSGNIYTIPGEGIYRAFLNAPSDDGMGYYASLDISTDGGSSWSNEGSYSNYQLIKKFNAGDKIKVIAGCAGSAFPQSTIDASKFIFAIKKF